MTAQQLALFVAKTCLCLFGDQGEPEGHDGECAYICATCIDTVGCDNCKVEAIFEGCSEPRWTPALGRNVATLRTVFGILEWDGWSGRPDTVAVLRPWSNRAGYRICMSYVSSASEEFLAYLPGARR
jgi:hypothetical protein